MSDIGLDALTDDQLVEMARAVAVEMARRDPGVFDAGRAAIAEVAAAQQSQDSQWARKKWIAKMVCDHISDGCSLNVWLSRDKRDRRVYIEQQHRARAKWVYYDTGNHGNPPRSLDEPYGRFAPDADAEIVKIICRCAIDIWPDGDGINCDVAAATDYDIPPEPQALRDRLQKMRGETTA